MVKAYRTHGEVKALPSETRDFLYKCADVSSLCVIPDYIGMTTKEAQFGIIDFIFEYSFRTETWSVQEIGDPPYSTMLWCHVSFKNMANVLFVMFGFVVDRLIKRRIARKFSAWKDVVEGLASS